jgi:hypothetical protein
MTKNPKDPDKFKFITKRTIREEIAELTDWQLNQLQSKTQRGVFWFQIEKGGLIHWNVTLLKSVLIHGQESSITAALVEEYIATLPQVA